MHPTLRPLLPALCAIPLALALQPAHAQQAPASASPANAPIDDEIVELSIFEVNAQKDEGYVASATLAGSRLNTELANTPAAISVLTSDFLSDIGALNTIDALEYSLNANREYDFGGLNLQQSDVNIQIRGFSSTAMTRDFFKWFVSSDNYNVERLDFSRGPNSVLFGIGGTGGILNSSTKQAKLRRNTRTVTLRVGSWNSYRGTFDINQSIGRKLAVRVNAMYQDTESWRDFENQKSKAIAGALTYRPFRNTEIRLQGEYGKREQVMANPWPVYDYSSAWIDAGRPLGASAGVNTRVQLKRLTYDPLSGTGLRSWYRAFQTVKGPSAPTGQNKDYTNFDVIPREVYIGGPGSTSDNDYSTYGIVFEQRIGRFTAEVAYNHQQMKRLANFPVQWGQMGVYGDPNATLPADLLPDGSTPIGGVGTDNPNAGQFYVESNWSYREISRKSEAYRLTLAYELDLRKHKLGVHRFAGLLQREEVDYETDAQFEIYTNAPGTTDYPSDLTNNANRIFRRTYLDFKSSDMSKRGMYNPKNYPINSLEGQGGVISGFRRVTDTNNTETTKIDSMMIGGQSAFWDSRINATWGVRRDKQDYTTAALAEQDPVTNLFYKRRPGAERTTYEGTTKTYGIVAWPLTWVAAFYNNANTFTPQSALNINNLAIGPNEGKGEDFGLKFRLFKNKINITLTRYKVTMDNWVITDTRLNSMREITDRIWTSIGEPGKVLPHSSRDVATQEGKGYEMEITANVTRDWKFSLNASRAEMLQTDTAPIWGSYLIDNHNAYWATHANDPITDGSVPGYTDPTIADAETFLNGMYGTIRAVDGSAPRQHSKYRVNAFTSYTLRKAPGLLRGFTIGAGVNYRSKPVTGYDSTAYLAPIYGDDYWVANAMFSWSRKLSFGTLKLQVNVQNLLDNDDLITTDKDETGVYRHRYINPRQVSLTATINF